MKYLLRHNKIRKKYEDEIAQILYGGKYRILKIESFADFSDTLLPFHECSMLLDTAVSPISFSECESHCKQLGVDTLVHYKTQYNEAKYKWTKKHCTQKEITLEENYEMLKKIQDATMSFGAFTIAFKCHRLHEKTVRSYYSESQIQFAPLLYDIISLDGNVSDYFCHRLAEKLFDNSDNPYHQMNIYTDNVLTLKDIDDMYPIIRKITQKYNEYVTTLYHTFKDSEIYRHREDFPIQQ